MNVHKNARLTPLGRERLVMAVLSGPANPRSLTLNAALPRNTPPPEWPGLNAVAPA